MSSIASQALKSIPADGDRFFERAVPGVLPLNASGDLQFRWDARPVAVLPGEILASWAHHMLHFAVASPSDQYAPETAIECFLVHRSNKSYSFWSIPPLEDYAMIDLESGFRAVFTADKMEIFTDQKAESGVLSHFALDTSTVAETRDFNALTLQHPREIQIIRGHRTFLEWYNPAVGDISITPAFLAADNQEPKTLGWIQTTTSNNGVASGSVEKVYSFADGWATMRTDTTCLVHKQFEHIAATF